MKFIKHVLLRTAIIMASLCNNKIVTVPFFFKVKFNVYVLANLSFLTWRNSLSFLVIYILKRHVYITYKHEDIRSCSSLLKDTTKEKYPTYSIWWYSKSPAKWLTTDKSSLEQIFLKYSKPYIANMCNELVYIVASDIYLLMHCIVQLYKNILYIGI